MKVLVTGGAGFIGRWLLRALPASIDVVVVDALIDDVHGPDPAFPADVLARATCLHCDLRDTDRWRAAAEGASVVVHLAALTGTGQSQYQLTRYVEHNVTATSRLLDALLGGPSPPTRIVLASSRAVYGEGAYLDGDTRVYPGPRPAASMAAGRFEPEGREGAEIKHVASRAGDQTRPSSIYGWTKLWQEQLVENVATSRGIDAVTLRFQNVYGPLQALRNPYTGVLGAFTQRMLAGVPVELYEDGRMTRDFVWAGDVAGALVAAITDPRRLSATFDVGSGVATTLDDVVTELGRLAGCAVKTECRGRFRVGDIRHASADTRPWSDTFGPWVPTPLSAGLAEYTAWVREQPWVSREALDQSVRTLEAHALLGSVGHAATQP